MLFKSIERNSSVKHELCLHVNEPSQDFLEWAQGLEIDVSYSLGNVGLSVGANEAATRASKELIYLIDDDMYVLPGWDVELFKFLEDHDLDPNATWLNSTMIEPKTGPTWSLGGYDYGRTPDTFREDELLQDVQSKRIPRIGTLNSTAFPCLISREVWEAVGGYDERIGIAIGSEEGLAKRAWDYGIRNFVNVPNSLIYHLQQTTTSRLTNYVAHMAHRERTFHQIYHMTTKEFNDKCIQRGTPWEKR